MRKALELGKPVLVEKPIALSLDDADDILETLRDGRNLRIGYSRRYKECFLRAKEQMLHGRLGKVVGGTGARLQFARAGFRHPQARSARDAGARRAHLLRRSDVLVPRGQSAGRSGRARATGIFKEAGYGAHDVTWAIVTFADGAVINFGVSYALPARYPTLGQSDRVELLGIEGTMIIDDDHMDHLLFSEKGIPHAYVPDHDAQDGVSRQQYCGRLGGRRFLGPARQRNARVARPSRHRRAEVHTTPEQARSTSRRPSPSSARSPPASRCGWIERDFACRGYQIYRPLPDRGEAQSVAASTPRRRPG